MKSNLSISTFIPCVFVAMSKNPLPNPRSWRFAAMFSSKSFIVLTLTFRSLIPFKLIFYMMWVKTTTSFLHIDLPSCPSTICWQYCSLPHWMIFSSVQSLSRVQLFPTPWTAACQASSPTPRVHINPCPLSQWCHSTISSSVIPFSSCPQSFPASGSFPISQLFASGGQSIGVSASTSVPPMKTQDWSPLGWTGWISLQSKGLSRVFSNTIVQKHQFFCAQPSL